MAKILVVEDDRDLNRAYRIILKHEGHQVTAAYNGKDALKKTKTSAPDLILLDLLMPIMGGLEFLETWSKQSPKNSKVLIFTNMENSKEITKAYKLGADRCIIKSWTAPHNLARVVSDTLKNK